MTRPATRILSTDAAAAAARALETPTDVKHFMSLAKESPSVRAFMESPEWPALYERVMGDGKLPTGAARNLSDIARFFRWTSDGSLGSITSDPGAAYRHCAMEIEALDKRLRRASPVSPAVPQPPAAAAINRMSFAEALTAVKAGAHIARSSWPVGVYVTAQAGYPQGIAINANTARATGLQEGTTAVFGPYLMRAVTSVAGWPPSFEPWTPDHGDLFAEDWVFPE